MSFFLDGTSPTKCCSDHGSSWICTRVACALSSPSSVDIVEGSWKAGQLSFQAADSLEVPSVGIAAEVRVALVAGRLKQLPDE